MAKIRVYELAKELGKDNKVMENLIRGLGVEIKGVMSTLDDDQAELVRRQVQGGGRREPERNDPRASGPAAVIRRPGRGPRPEDEEQQPEVAARPTPPVVRPAPVQQQPQPQQQQPAPVIRRPVPPPTGAPQPVVRPSAPVVRPSEPSRPPETPWSTPAVTQPREPQREVRAVAEPIEVRERPSEPVEARPSQPVQAPVQPAVQAEPRLRPPRRARSRRLPSPSWPSRSATSRRSRPVRPSRS
ncbi:translation initiation factor IF-2 N-terminal domain-containing protein [Nannocystis pusilla]|uniref:translation initiation factor IF-2 N-terminal domain-containing protein n=1 Tax=Nannocystis pusilla TaxID=889268 RepID=UPI003B81A16E